MKSTEYIAPKTQICGCYVVTTLCASEPVAPGGGGGGEENAPARKLYV